MILALLNQKGGVGKTTLATHIAGELSNGGKKLVVIDAVPQVLAVASWWWLTDGTQTARARSCPPERHAFTTVMLLELKALRVAQVRAGALVFADSHA